MASPDTSDDQAKKALLRLLGEGAATGVNWYDPADRRLAGLVGRLSAGDQIWLLRCIAWLRGHEVLGPAAIVAAAELVHARLASGAQGGNRRIIGLVLRHPAEPGALLGYWITVHGKVPKPVQRGVADAVKTLYTPQTSDRHDEPGHGLRFGDVLAIAHPHPDTPQQAALFQRLLAQPRSDVTTCLPVNHHAPAPELADTLTTAAETGEHPF
ncbi:hypothetical protein [Actinomadura sp. SCN-SB]|uniref:hypothetical protein n=1 Tax=Actinomadura sp. SCN-SB TaxID=3373092 RepID=UPI00375359B8